MTNAAQFRQLKGFYENELTNNILPFWLSRCLDIEHGGYFNCFNNNGEHLVSTDKYTWSQGRFVWLFSKLSAMEGETFTRNQRAQFFDLAEKGARFLKEHCLIGPNDWRCVFLMDETGAPKRVSGYDALDMSIFADCFVVCGLARFALVSGSEEDYKFAKRLYLSCLERVESNTFQTLPYPLAVEYRAHSIPMILINVAAELFRASERFDATFSALLEKDIARFSNCVLTQFADANDVIHEVTRSDGTFFDGLLGEHANPGHTLEDMWFLSEAADLLDDLSFMNRASRISKKALEIGWDAEYGGILHYVSLTGGAPREAEGGTGEPTETQVAEGWGDKLWWVHAEALYTTLLYYARTGDSEFLEWHQKVFDYTFTHFPNHNREVREWVQILRRDGTPQEKVVALPVKDPYHIARALILLIELLSKAETSGKSGKFE